jgi:hypothetical protein
MPEIELNVQSFGVAPLDELFSLDILGRSSTSMVWHNRVKVNVFETEKKGVHV